MPSTPIIPPSPETLQASILAVVVLYKCNPSESRSLVALTQLLGQHPELARHFSLIVYDNSPHRQSHEIAGAGKFVYQHDPANAGLATAYNFALYQAEKQGQEWLLLLDQDTLPTFEFLAELVSCTDKLRQQYAVASIVPKLLVDGRIYSPAPHFIDQIRHQYRRTRHTVKREICGIQNERLSAYNSGSTLRVAALRAIGGFPPEYWLDYLDHAVFHALSVHGYHMFVMQSEMQHDSSQRVVRDVPLWRQRNVLFSQIRFVKQTGGLIDRLLYRIWLLRYSRSLRIDYPDTQLWKEAAWQALVLSGRPDKTPFESH